MKLPLNPYYLKKLLISLILIHASVSFCEAQINVINAGVGGNTTTDLLKRMEVDVLAKNPEIVIIMVGTNDMVNSKKMIPYSNYHSNLDRIMRNCMEGNIRVLLISSPPVDSAYLFLRHPRESFSEAPNVKLDSARKIVEQVSMQYGADFIDLYEKFCQMDIPNHNRDDFIRNKLNSGIRDGVHPTRKGYQLIAETIFQFFADHEIVTNDLKVVCFGDSITRGGAKGEDGSTGNSYPTYLLTMLNNWAHSH